MSPRSSLHIARSRSLRLALGRRCLPRSLADEKHVGSLARPGQRRASLFSTSARDPYFDPHFILVIDARSAVCWAA
jgi:hypothetical protein